MKFIFKYETPEERDSIISANEGSYLVGIKNITEGNFLIFADEPLPVAPHPLIAEERVIQLEQSLAETNAMILEFMEASLMGGM